MSETVSNPLPTESATGAEQLAAAAPRRRAHLMRWAGNLLIGVGVLLLIGVGGYLGLQAFMNTQEAAEIRNEGTGLNLAPNLPPATVAPSPTAGDAGLAGVNPPAPTPTTPSSAVIVASLPLPDLNSGGGLGSRIPPAQTDPPTYLTIPSVKIDSPVVPVGWEMIPGKEGRDSAQWEVAEYAVGHHKGSANPGEIGNVVMSGHVDWKGEVFRNLHKVERGAEVYVYSGEREYLYIVQDKVLVKEEGPDVTDEMRRQNAAYMNPTLDQTLTLITCWPYGVDDHRLIVIAKPYDSGLPARPDLVLK
jgi:sortase A